MKGYLYVINETGAEVPGSRRSLDACQNLGELAAVRRELESKMGEDCLVLDSEVDRGPTEVDRGAS